MNTIHEFGGGVREETVVANSETFSPTLDRVKMRNITKTLSQNIQSAPWDSNTEPHKCDYMSRYLKDAISPTHVTHSWML